MTSPPGPALMQGIGGGGGAGMWKAVFASNTWKESRVRSYCGGGGGYSSTGTAMGSVCAHRQTIPQREIKQQ